jgi:hypothetical protein
MVFCWSGSDFEEMSVDPDPGFWVVFIGTTKLKQLFAGGRSNIQITPARSVHS